MSRRPLITKNPESPEHCYESALKILGFRWNSMHELEQKLLRKGFETEVVDGIISRLLREKWLDDRRFALSKARALLARKLGPARATRELSVAGVERQLVREVVDEVFDRDAKDAAILVLCRKKMRLLSRGTVVDWTEDHARRNKLFGWLLKQGYESADVSSAIRQLKIELRIEIPDADYQ